MPDVPVEDRLAIQEVSARYAYIAVGATTRFMIHINSNHIIHEYGGDTASGTSHLHMECELNDGNASRSSVITRTSTSRRMADGCAQAPRAGRHCACRAATGIDRSGAAKRMATRSR